MKLKFKSEKDRQLWIKLNAERIVKWEKNLTYFDKETQTHKPTMQARNHRSMETALKHSAEMCKYNEENDNQLNNYTLEELLTLNRHQLEEIRLKKHRTFCKKHFG